jgi:alkylhydroperoxidase/carboxymuconolactone decarboxylase family protein YurZ
VENITGFLLEAIRKNFANPEFAQERKRQEVVEALKVNKKRKTQIERLEAQKVEIEKARDQALSDTYGEMARTFPEVLEAALSSILVGNKFWLNMDSRELITLPVVRVACLALGTCSIGPNG